MYQHDTMKRFNLKWNFQNVKECKRNHGYALRNWCLECGFIFAKMQYVPVRVWTSTEWLGQKSIRMVRTCVLELETRPAAKTQRLRADLPGWQRYVGVSLRVQQRCTREISLDDRFFTDTNLNDTSKTTDCTTTNKQSRPNTGSPNRPWPRKNIFCTNRFNA